jgi:hypothetical protein
MVPQVQMVKKVTWVFQVLMAEMVKKELEVQVVNEVHEVQPVNKAVQAKKV